MKRQLRAEGYKIIHSSIIPIIAVFFLGIVVLSLHNGPIFFYAAGNDQGVFVGFQAQAYYYSIEKVIFTDVLKSAVAYTPFFGIVILVATAIFFTEEYKTGTIKLAVAIGTKKWKIYISKAILLTGVSFLLYSIFIFVFLIMGLYQSAYIYQFNVFDLIEMIRLAFLNYMILLGFQFFVIFFCVLFRNLGVVIGMCTVYIFAAAEIYLSCWNSMKDISILTKIFLYCNPMYYWMNYCSYKVEGIITNMRIFVLVSIFVLCLGGFIINKRELK